MTTSELVSYIKKQIANNVSKDLIISKLLGVGWHREDIDEGFLSIKPEVKLNVSLPDINKEIHINPIMSNGNNGKIVDKYHEPIEGDNIFEVKKEPQKVEEVKVEIPSEVSKIEEKKIEVPIVPKTEPVKKEIPKVWIPMSVPIKEKIQAEEVKPQTTQIEIQNPELETKELINNTNIDKITPVSKEEFIPMLKPKFVTNPFDSLNKDNTIKSDSITVPDKSSNDSSLKNLPKIAMLSSYQNDLMSMKNSIKGENIEKKRNKIIIKSLIIILIIVVISLVAWGFISGYINIKSLNFSFIKKDPKVLLLNNSEILSSLKSYKTETNIDILSPSFSNISYGLISGEAVSSVDKDSININNLGIINQTEGGLLSDNSIIIKGSMLSDSVTLDVKQNESDLFVSTSDLSKIIKENTIESSIIKINEQQFNLIPPLFSPEIEVQLSKINIYNILSGGIPSYINNDTLGVYNELINNVEITEKEQENIKGIDTYHYRIIVDRQLAKNLLMKISDNFINNLSDEDKNRVTQIVSSVTINSFDVWIGKGDNNIYQYSVILDIPLSKIIGFEDKSIGDNTVSISWKTTYYDFNISNNILVPDTSIPMTDFIKNVKETRMKSEVSSFNQLATDLSKIEGSYGKKSNTSGGCMNPTSGSLFSPTGHSKNSVTAVSSISLFLNKILGITGGVGSCYSTTKAWSFAIPISDNYDPASIPEGGYQNFFCVDSTGVTEELTSIPTSVICTPKVDLPKI
jgi:hypothetical protein